MQRTLKVVVATTLSLGFLVGCGTTVRPFVRTGGSGAASGGSPGGQLSPRPDSDRASRDDAQPIVDEICRSEPMRAGWIATRYLRDAGNCAASTDPENPYTAAVIERYSHLPVGSTMVVCADQSIPR